MGDDWLQVKIENIQADSKGAIAIGPFGSRMKSDCYVGSGIPVIRGTNITGGTQIDGNFVFITEEKADSLGSSNVYDGDLVFPHRGAIGEVGIISDGKRYVISSSLMKLTCNQTQADPKYIYYFFKGNTGRHELLKNASQVGTPGIGQPLTSLKGIELKLPPLSTQKYIAHILTTLDDKIELNRQMNTTLEAMTQALFKSWFVDFDPVIDNALAAGNPIPEALQSRAAIRQALGDKRKPLPETIQQQFPSSFVFTEEMGWVPEGWKPKPLDYIAHYQNGLALQKFRPEDESDFLPVLKIAHLRKGCTDGEEKASPDIKPECIIDDGDVVFSWSGSLMVDIWCGGKAALNQHLFKVTSELVPKWFYYQYTIHHLYEFQRIAADKAVTMGHIKREHLRQALCAVPPETLIYQCSEVMDGWLNKAIMCRVENKQLVKLRDTLLPKLLSGELRIPDAENHLAKVS